MTPSPRRFAVLALALTSALGGCGRMTGGSTDQPPLARVPADETLREIPLGAPPGEATSIAASIRNPFEGDPAAIQDGKRLFTQMNCVYCHGPQASGLMGPSLNDRAWRYGGTPAEIYNSIHDGRPKGMPAWGARLPPQQIWQLVAYVESLGGGLPPAEPGMASLGGPAPSTTGPQPAEQQQTDTAHQTLEGSERGQRR
ncbi:MAG TPA: c-type cytochrome [Myxococcales bacterium]